jgi:hypothetical protein
MCFLDEETGNNQAANMIFFKWHERSNLTPLKRIFFCETSDVAHAYLNLLKTL